MKAKPSIFLRAMAVTALLAVAAACGGGASSEGSAAGESDGTPKQGGDLVAGVRTLPASLDPALCSNPSGFSTCSAIYGTLLRHNMETAEFEPALAESFESSDGVTWTLKLRPGTTFTDGTPLDAEAVAYNWERAKEPTLLSPAMYWLGQVKGWKVVDDTTLEVTLNEANYLFRWALQYELGAIGSPTALKADAAAFATEPVGAGPFMLTDLVANSQASFERNPDYVEEGLPHADTLTLKVIQADDQRANALRAGEINLNTTFVNNYATDLEDEGYPTQRMQLWGGTSLAFNLEDEVAGDDDFRAAMLHAFNAEQITAASYAGEEPVTAWFRSDSPYRDDAAGVFPEFDLAAAQEAFDAYLAKVGKDSLEVELTSYGDYPIMVQVAELLQQQFNEIDGLTVELRPLPAATQNAAIRSGDYTIAMTGAANQQSPETMLRFLHTDGDLNSTNYSNPEVDELLELLRTSTDEAEKTAALKKVGGILSTDAPYRPFALENDTTIVAQEIHGVNPVNLGAMTWELLWVE